jgi:hypothetical protein
MVMVIVVVAQEPRTQQVHDEAHGGERDRLVERDRDRADQSIDALIADQEGDHRQDKGAGESSEVAELAVPKKAAELNGYPGPKHVLETALSSRRRAARVVIDAARSERPRAAATPRPIIAPTGAARGTS